ncbi:hypothetical protein HPB50_025576 [Hyalomma asiaticum]|uniref:Uncharacterized protein n=1 Tax=Hyalomma asiaticum TaxID=266040 RepID=A0ACB7SR77_HYAAI|nr:hypothetical protein HPB50_025576 [Hyalomma asiaticum]
MTSHVSGGQATRRSVWRTCGQVYGQLALDSGLPGAEALVEGGSVRRLLWTGALLTLLYYSMSETCAILREYFTFSVAVTFEYSTNDSFELPDVTVCNVNPLRRSKLCALDASAWGLNHEVEERVCGKGQDFQVANPDDLRLQHNISDWIAHYKPTKREWLKTLGHQFADMFVDCTYHEEDCRNETLFRYITNVYFGNCFCHRSGNTQRLDYNGLSSPYNGNNASLYRDDLRLQHNISDWIAHYKPTKREWLKTLGHQFADMFVDCTYHEEDCRNETLFRYITHVHFGNCFCHRCGNTRRLDYSGLSSPYNGLVVTLNPELDEYLPTSYQAGFIAMVHAHGTRFSLCSDGVYLSPGYTTYVGLNLDPTCKNHTRNCLFLKRTIRSQFAQTGLPEPYANPCRSSWPRRLAVHMANVYGSYTREDCLNMCLQVVVVETCGCWSAQLPHFSSLAERHEVCVDKGLKCAEHVADIQTSITLERECGCLPACQ